MCVGLCFLQLRVSLPTKMLALTLKGLAQSSFEKFEVVPSKDAVGDFETYAANREVAAGRRKLEAIPSFKDAKSKTRRAPLTLWKRRLWLSDTFRGRRGVRSAGKSAALSEWLLFVFLLYPFRPGTCASQRGCEVACSTLM